VASDHVARPRLQNREEKEEEEEDIGQSMIIIITIITIIIIIINNNHKHNIHKKTGRKYRPLVILIFGSLGFWGCQRMHLPGLGKGGTVDQGATLEKDRRIRRCMECEM
jgi:hypothetical protein